MSNDKLAEALRACMECLDAETNSTNGGGYTAYRQGAEVLQAHAAEAAQAQPAQDAKDAATIERVARAIYTHVFTMSIPRMGVRTATFDEVWAIPAERERLTAQAHAAIDAAMAKEFGR